jgi:CheY-like chemotaxis protein
LLKLNLETSGLLLTTFVVVTRDGLLEQLDGFRPDIVISDCTLPSLSGIEALRENNARVRQPRSAQQRPARLSTTVAMRWP